MGGCDGHSEEARAVTRARRGGPCGGGVHGDAAREVARTARYRVQRARAARSGRREGHKGQRRGAGEVERARLQGLREM